MDRFRSLLLDPIPLKKSKMKEERHEQVNEDNTEEETSNSPKQKYQNSNNILKASKKISKPPRPMKPMVSNKLKRSDYNRVKLVSIGFPEKVTPSPNQKLRSTKRYVCTVSYMNPETGKRGKKQIRFGNVDKKEYVDHHDEGRKYACTSKLGNTENFLHPNFYKRYLLNGRQDNIYDAYKDLSQAIEQENLIDNVAVNTNV